MIALLLALVLSSCINGPVPQGKIASTDKMSVVSLIDEKIYADYKGIFRHNNEEAFADLSDWGVPAVVLSEFQKNLAANTVLADLSVEEDVFAKLRAEEKGFFKNRSPLEDYLLERAKTQGISFVWMVEPLDRRPDGDFYDRIRGFGAFCPISGLTPKKWILYTQFMVALWDVQTKKKAFAYFADPMTPVGPSEEFTVKTQAACDSKNRESAPELLKTFKESYLGMLSHAIRSAIVKAGLANK